MAATEPEKNERKLPAVIKAGMVMRGGSVTEDRHLLEPPPPVYPPGYIPPEVAHAQAQAILHQANEQAHAIRQQAQESGMQQGHQEGFFAGQEAARAGFKALLDSLRDQIEALLNQRQEMLASAEPDLLRLALMAAGKVIQQEIRFGDLAAKLVSRTILRAGEGTVLRIKVSPADLQQLGSLESPSGELARYELIADSSIGQGGCVIESSLCTIDASFRTMFEEVARELMQEDPGTESIIAEDLRALEAATPPGAFEPVELETIIYRPGTRRSAAD